MRLKSLFRKNGSAGSIPAPGTKIKISICILILTKFMKLFGDVTVEKNLIKVLLLRRIQDFVISI